MRRARSIRLEQGLSQEDVTRRTSISTAHLGRFERGLVDLGLKKLLELSDLLGVSINELAEEIPDDEEPEGARRR